MDVEDGSLQAGLPVPEFDRKRTAEKKLDEDNFYVAETDEDREKNTENLSVSDLQEIRHRASQALRRTQGIYTVQAQQQSDWFINKLPENMDLWPTSHPMAFEMQACLKPLINAKSPVRIEDLQERMQERGAYMLRVEENPDSRLWNLLFYLDTRFYCEIEMGGGIPEIVKEIFQKEQERKAAETQFAESLEDKNSRVKIIEKRTDSLLREGEKTDEQEEDEAEEERLAQEERDAKDAQFHLKGVQTYIYNYRLFVANK